VISAYFCRADLVWLGRALPSHRSSSARSLCGWHASRLWRHEVAPCHQISQVPFFFQCRNRFFWISGSLKSKPLRSHWLFVAPRPEGSKYSGMFERGRGLAMHATVVASGISIDFFFRGFHGSKWVLDTAYWHICCVFVLTADQCCVVHSDNSLKHHFKESNYHKSAWGCVNINWDVTSLCFLWELEFDERYPLVN